MSRSTKNLPPSLCPGQAASPFVASIDQRIEEVDSGVNSSEYVAPVAVDERPGHGKMPRPDVATPNGRYDRYDLEREETQEDEERRELQEDLDLFDAAGPAIHENQNQKEAHDGQSHRSDGGRLDKLQ